MLFQEENDFLACVGAEAPMGKLLRRYWIPALLSEELPAPDCDPVQVRLLGEDLVAYRDSLGRIGLLGEHWSHRGTSLFYGRNEQCGLRCIYHGWKYDFEGNVLETPAEPAHSALPVKEDDFPREPEVGADYRKVRNLHNRYLQDRQWQKENSYTGIAGFLTQDSCATESMGTVCDRAREHLGVSDSFVIAARRHLLTVLDNFEKGEEPPGLARSPDENDFSDIVCEASVSSERKRAEAGKPL